MFILVQGFSKSQFITVSSLLFFEFCGLICFNIRDGQLDDYQGKISELDTSGKWEKVSRTVIPFFESDGMPKETMVFVYKVLDVII